MTPFQIGTALTVIGLLITLGRILWNFSANVANLGSAISDLRDDMREERKERREGEEASNKVFTQVFTELKELRGDHTDLREKVAVLTSTCKMQHRESEDGE